MLKDAATFKTRLGGIDGAGNVPEIIEEAVNNKVISGGSDTNNGGGGGSNHPSRTGTPISQQRNGN